ncbi:MAG: hypothetical protein CMP62_00920 [Flavobacteriales bacterium]|nr:hypothetical protein [Flavobacteriales bacterium]
MGLDLNIFKKFIFSAFIRPFFLTFSIVITILLMQFLWKYIDDLIGKGLEWNIIIELLWYSSITLIPIALPLAILLASMMLTGSLSENSELTAINSIGKPFTYIINPLLLFSLLITLSSFMISNYAIPYANLKATTLMYDIIQKKLNINIQEKVFFSEIEGYSIRVDKKLSNNMMENIILYDYVDKKGIKQVFTARNGKMSITGDNKLLIINLYNGESYNEVLNEEQEYILKTKFEQYNLALDLSAFEMERSNSDRFSNRAKTMNMNQLKKHVDSLKSEYGELQKSLLSNFIQETKFNANKSHNLEKRSDNNLNNVYKAKSHNKIKINEQIQAVQNYQNKSKIIKKKINKFQVERHRKLTLPLACMIMLLIGSPIGAIIKKGGFGLPVVFSIFLFLIYHIISITGEKMVKKDVIDPFIGMWTSTIIMFMVGVVLLIVVNNNYFEKIWLKKY